MLNQPSFVGQVLNGVTDHSDTHVVQVLMTESKHVSEIKMLAVSKITLKSD